MNKRPEAEVFYDGACSLCDASRRWTERRDRAHRLRFVDFNRHAAGTHLPVPRELLEETLWARLPGGRLVSGYAAWLEVLARLPRWRWLAAAGKLPPVASLGPRVYRLVARHRHRVTAR